MTQRALTLLRGLAALAALTALVIGVPAVLVLEVGWPLPTRVPTWQQIANAITSGGIDDAAIIKTLAALVWLAWANFTTGLVVEVAALTRGRRPRRLAGLGAAQHLAANLLTAASLAAAVLSRPAAPSAVLQPDLRLAVTSALAEQPPEINDAPGLHTSPSLTGVLRADEQVVRAPSGAATEAGHVYEVRHGDTLWDIAQRFLGDGLRWREIRELNTDRVQPDSATLGADGEDIHPGWKLLVPPSSQSSDGPELRGTHATDGDGRDADTESTVTVEHGDTLWDLADEELDDPHRWPDLYERNRGEPQPDGQTLTDPDLIQPGWILHLPDAGSAGVPASRTDTVEKPSQPEADPEDSSAARRARPEPPAITPQPPVETRSADPDHSGAQLPPGAEPQGHRGDGEGSTRAPSHDTNQAGDPIEDIAVPAAGAALAAGLVLTLDRLRRARLRRRMPGYRIPVPEGEHATTESHLRALAEPDTATFVDLALRDLAGSCEPGQVLPSVVLASYGPDDLAVHLDAAADGPPEGWEPHDGGLTWVYPRPDDLDELADRKGIPSRLPTLVTLGQMASGRTALLNLSHAGTLHLDGDPDRIAELLTAWALELATTPSADALEILTLGLSDLPDALERLETLDDADELRTRLAAPAPTDRGVPGVVVLAAETTNELAAWVTTAAGQRPGLVTAVAGSASEPGAWALHLDGDTGRLEPEGLAVNLLDLPCEDLVAASRLLHQAKHDPDKPVDNRDLTGERKRPPDSNREPAVEVRILGPVEIDGAGPFTTNKTIELVVYLAMRRSGAGTDTLLEALWPEQPPRAARLYTEASRARKALGAAADGSPCLPDAELGRYRLSDAVALDFDRFKSLVAAARRDPAAAEQHLREALTLVRGVPLSATASEYAWATSDGYRIAQEVADTAHELAQLYLEQSRYDDAVWAAEQGLAADPLAETLLRDLMEVAAATGNTARVHAIMTRLRRQLAEDGEANDADDWLHPDTIATYERLSSNVN